MDVDAAERMHLWGRSPLLTASSLTNGDGAGPRHYVIRYRGRGPAPAADVARIVGAVHVLDHVSRMLLVEGCAAQMASLAATLPRWLVREERAFALVRGSNGASDHDADSSRDDSEGADDELTHHPLRAADRPPPPLGTGGRGASGGP